MVGGKISYPGTAATYRTYMKFVKHNELKVRAYLGLRCLENYALAKEENNDTKIILILYLRHFLA